MNLQNMMINYIKKSNELLSRILNLTGEREDYLETIIYEIQVGFIYIFKLLSLYVRNNKKHKFLIEEELEIILACVSLKSEMLYELKQWISNFLLEYIRDFQINQLNNSEKLIELMSQFIKDIDWYEESWLIPYWTEILKVILKSGNIENDDKLILTLDNIKKTLIRVLEIRKLTEDEQICLREVIRLIIYLKKLNIEDYENKVKFIFPLKEVLSILSTLEYMSIEDIHFDIINLSIEYLYSNNYLYKQELETNKIYMKKLESILVNTLEKLTLDDKQLIERNNNNKLSKFKHKRNKNRKFSHDESYRDHYESENSHDDIINSRIDSEDESDDSGGSYDNYSNYRKKFKSGNADSNNTLVNVPDSYRRNYYNEDEDEGNNSESIKIKHSKNRNNLNRHLNNQASMHSNNSDVDDSRNINSNTSEYDADNDRVNNKNLLYSNRSKKKKDEDYLYIKGEINDSEYYIFLNFFIGISILKLNLLINEISQTEPIRKGIKESLNDLCACSNDLFKAIIEFSMNYEDSDKLDFIRNKTLLGLLHKEDYLILKKCMSTMIPSFKDLVYLINSIEFNYNFVNDKNNEEDFTANVIKQIKGGKSKNNNNNRNLIKIENNEIDNVIDDINTENKELVQSSNRSNKHLNTAFLTTNKLKQNKTKLNTKFSKSKTINFFNIENEKLPSNIFELWNYILQILNHPSKLNSCANNIFDIINSLINEERKEFITIMFDYFDSNIDNLSTHTHRKDSFYSGINSRNTSDSNANGEGINNNDNNNIVLKLSRSKTKTSLFKQNMAAFREKEKEIEMTKLNKLKNTIDIDNQNTKILQLGTKLNMNSNSVGSIAVNKTSINLSKKLSSNNTNNNNNTNSNNSNDKHKHKRKYISKYNINSFSILNMINTIYIVYLEQNYKLNEQLYFYFWVLTYTLNYNLDEKQFQAQSILKNKTFISEIKFVNLFMKIMQKKNLRCVDYSTALIIKFLNQYLQGIEETKRHEFYNMLINNHESEHFFIMIKYSIDNIKSKISQAYSKQAGTEREEIQILSKYENEIRSFEEIFVFLSNLLENNKISGNMMKDYIRFQHNNSKSYNFLISITSVLEYFIDKNNNLHDNVLSNNNNANLNSPLITNKILKNYYNTLINAIDALIKSSQGPCFDNQTTLINETKILDLIAFYLFRVTYRKDSNFYYGDKTGQFWYSCSDLGINKSQLSKLKFKILLLLMSLAEGRKKGDIIYNKIAFSIDWSQMIEVLTETLREIMREKKVEFLQDLILDESVLQRVRLYS